MTTDDTKFFDALETLCKNRFTKNDLEFLSELVYVITLARECDFADKISTNIDGTQT